ncbi:MAG: nucleotidyltransferase family protein [Planctomycetota bacterium]
MMLPVVILAGGLATRLRPVTEKIPKALVEVAGKPFIAHQLELLKKNNIERIVLCVGYRGGMIQDLIGDGRKLGLHIDYSSDWPDLLGTGGAVKKALPLLGESFFILYGDSYLACDYDAVRQAFQKSGKPALMAVFRNENKWDKSNIVYQNGQILKHDKRNITPEMKYIDYGLSAVNKNIFETAGFGDKFDLADLYKNLVDRGQMAGYEVNQRFYEIGTARGIGDFQEYLNDNNKKEVL